MDIVTYALIAIIVIIWGWIIYDAKTSKERYIYWMMPLFCISIIFFFQLIYSIFTLQGTTAAAQKIVPVMAFGVVIGLVFYLLAKDKKRPLYDHFKKQTQVFFGSWKLKAGILSIILFDIIFILLSYAGLRIWSNMISSISGAMPELDASILDPQNSAGLENQLLSIENSVYYMMVASVVFVIFIFLSWSLFQGLIWKMLAKAKKIFYLRFVLLNIIWAAIWFIPLIMPLFAMSGYAQRTTIDTALVINVVLFLVVFLAVVFFLVHFTQLLYYHFYKKGVIFKSISSAFSTGFTKIHLFLVPLAYIFMILMLLNVINYWMSFLVPPMGYLVLNFIALIFFLAWSRTYFVLFYETLIATHGKARHIRTKN